MVRTGSVVVIVGRHLRQWLVCGLVAAMPALCLAQREPARAAPPAGARAQSAAQSPGESADLERLYALGIDACRIAQEMARGRTGFDLDGVTGKLTVQAGLIGREPIQAGYRDGEAVFKQSVLP